MLRSRTAPLLLILALLPLAAARGGAIGSTREVRAVRAPSPPHVDGKLDDEVWQLAPPITGFTQQEPDTGAPATEQTIVRLLFDDHALYVGAQLDDSGPVTRKLARRDSFLAADWFAVYLDTHHDHRVARQFRVGAAGVLRDSIVEGDDFMDEDRSWDPVWDGVAATTATGWSVEMRIPYSQLRFPDVPAQLWGINFHREISRTNEYSRLVHVPRNESGFIARFAHLVGIEAIEPPRRLEILPYAIMRSRRDGSALAGDPFSADGDVELDGGIDLEYGLASNLTLSATINPDFGQVEADPAQLNLTEFEIFYDEKRPFFLEGAELFSFRAADLFYSRRIGRAPQGGVPAGVTFHDSPADTTIAGALKLSGKTTGGWSVGVLDAWTLEESAHYEIGGERHAALIEPATNYFVGRLARDLSERSSLGGMITAVNRSDGGDLLLHDAAYAAGVDGYTYFGNRDYILEWGAYGSQVSGSREAIAATQRAPGHYFHRPDADYLDFDPGRTSLAGWGAFAGFEKETGKWRYGATSSAASPELEINDLGFRTRVDTVAAGAGVGWVDPEPRAWWREREITIEKEDIWNFGGDRRVDRIEARGGIELANYWRAELSVRHDGRAVDDRATRGGPLAGTPDATWYEVELSTDHRKAVNLNVEAGYGSDELGGFDRDLELRVQWQPSERASLEIAPQWSDARVARQFVRRVADPAAVATYGARYVFAPVETGELDLTTRFDLAITRNLTFQLYVQPFVARGDYDGFRELARPASLDSFEYGVDAGAVAYDPAMELYTIDPDGSGGAPPFSFRNPDFKERSLRGNAVVRWEFRPGSTAYLVWSQNRSGRISDADIDFGGDLDALTSLPADDVIMIKVSYWLGL